MIVLSMIRGLQNVLIASTTPIHVKLADFGISKCAKGTRLDTQLGTPEYQAPELVGIPPQATRRGYGLGYTKAVDIWALGCLLHKILTMKTPFLATETNSEYTDLSSGIDLSSSIDEPQTDFHLLSEYCSGKIGLPTELLQFQTSDIGIDFVKKCLTPDPESRISSSDALNHQWVKLALNLNQKNIPYIDFDAILDLKNGLQAAAAGGQTEAERPINRDSEIGDLTTVGNLVHQLMVTLKDRRPTTRYSDLISALGSLRLTLLELANFGSFEAASSNAIQFQLCICAKSIKDFLSSSRRYTESMLPNVKERTSLDGSRDITWYCFKTEDMQRLHLNLQSHTQAFMMFPNIARSVSWSFWTVYRFLTSSLVLFVLQTMPLSAQAIEPREPRYNT